MLVAGEVQWFLHVDTMAVCSRLEALFVVCIDEPSRSDLGLDNGLFFCDCKNTRVSQFSGGR